MCGQKVLGVGVLVQLPQPHLPAGAGDLGDPTVHQLQLICMHICRQTNTNTITHTHTHTHTHARTHARTRTRSHTHTHINSHTQNVPCYQPPHYASGRHPKHTIHHNHPSLQPPPHFLVSLSSSHPTSDFPAPALALASSLFRHDPTRVAAGACRGSRASLSDKPVMCAFCGLHPFSRRLKKPPWSDMSQSL